MVRDVMECLQKQRAQYCQYRSHGEQIEWNLRAAPPMRRRRLANSKLFTTVHTRGRLVSAKSLGSPERSSL